MRIDAIHCCGWGDGSEESCALAKRFNTDLYTIISAMGWHTMENKTVLICALKENETENFQEHALGKDPAAFIIFTGSTRIMGNGFGVYK